MGPISASAPPCSSAQRRHPARWACSMASRNGQTSPPVDADAGDGALGDGCPALRGWNAERPWARDMRNSPEPSVGSRLRSAVEDGVASVRGRGRSCAGTCDGGTGNAAPAPPSGHAGSPEGGPGSRRAAQPSTSPPRPREARRSRGSYPTGRRWGADPGELGVGTPSPLWGREAGHGGPAGYRSPTVGKPVTVPASRSACGICGRPACGKKPRRQQRFIPRTRGSTPGHHSCSGACVRRSLSGCPPSVPAVEAPIQGSSLRPC